MEEGGEGLDLSMRLRATPAEGPACRPCLDLLPLHPLAMAAGRGAGGHSVMNNNNNSCGSGSGSGGIGIDVNQIPCTADCDDAVLSSPNSINVKRERERAHAHDFDLLDADRDRDRSGVCDMSSRGSDEEEGGGATRKKLRLSKDQSALLEESFKEHSTLNPKQKAALAKQLNLRPRQVEVWFQNRRARTKLKQTEVDCELLKRYCENLSEENRRLQKELQELRAIKVPPPCVIAHDFYMPLPAATLTMCPSCERLATVDNRSTLAFSKSNYSHFSQSSAAC